MEETQRLCAACHQACQRSGMDDKQTKATKFRVQQLIAVDMGTSSICAVAVPDSSMDSRLEGYDFAIEAHDETLVGIRVAPVGMPNW